MKTAGCVLLILVIAIAGVAAGYEIRARSARLPATDTVLPRPYREGPFVGKRGYRVDFIALQARRDELDGQVVFIKGYLASDTGLLVVYPSDVDYKIQRNDSSLSVRFPASAQKALFAKYKYQFVNMAAVYRKHERGSDAAGRMGALFPPFEAWPIEVREPNAETEIHLFDVDDLTR